MAFPEEWENDDWDEVPQYLVIVVRDFTGRVSDAARDTLGEHYAASGVTSMRLMFMVQLLERLERVTDAHLESFPSTLNINTWRVSNQLFRRSLPGGQVRDMSQPNSPGRAAGRPGGWTFGLQAEHEHVVQPCLHNTLPANTV